MSIRILRDVNTAFGDFAAHDIIVGLSPSQEAALVNNNNADAVLADIGLGGNAGVVLSSGALTVSGLLKTGPSKVFSIVQTSGAGKPTLRDGVTVGGALVSGWGAGGASGLTLTANTPYSPSTPPTDFANGIYVEINGTATVIVFYQ